MENYKVSNPALFKKLKPLGLWILCLIIIVGLTFYRFPILGHDFSLGIIWANDYHFAWNKFGVFNIQFTPQRCGGVPVWANPLNANFSLVHLLSILLNDLGAIIGYITVISALGFYGTRKFLNLFNLNECWKDYLSVGWTIQGFIVSHVLVGHYPFINLSLWPLYAYLLIKNFNRKRGELLAAIAFSLLLAHDFYSANTYLFIMFPLAFLVLLLTLKINAFSVNYKHTCMKFLGGCLLAGLIILPKVLAVSEFTKNFQRDVSFIDIGFTNALNYTFMLLFVPFHLNFNAMTGWWYGNWESANYLLPFFFLLLLFKGGLDFRNCKKSLLGMLILFLLGTLISSGAYADLIKHLPVLKSLHVNPRFLPIIFLGLFATAALFLEVVKVPAWVAYALTLTAFAMPFTYTDAEEFQINYLYRTAYDVKENRAQYCYEPIFGYRLELLPAKNLNGLYADPRCYLGNTKCKDINLPKELYKELEEYKLKPFD